MRMTVSGDKRPCEVGKEGSVSLEASTDCDSVTGEVRFRSARLTTPSLSIFCAVMLGVSDVGKLVGAYCMRVVDGRVFLGDGAVHACTEPKERSANSAARTVRCILVEAILYFV